MIEKDVVTAKTPCILIFLTPLPVPSSVTSSSVLSSVSSVTERIETAEIIRRLKAAEPTMVEAPSSPGF